MPSIFEIIGPAMIGPSSSHTAGAVRIGLVARHLFGTQPESARIGLHGSFAATGHGHATDRGIVAGLLGWTPDDERLKDSLPFAEKSGLAVDLCQEDLGETVHPNSTRIVLQAKPSGTLEVIASSIGGGSIEVESVDGFAVRFSGTLDTLVLWHEDRSGFLAEATAALARFGSNIATIRTARIHRGARALTVIECDAPADPEAVALLREIAHVSKLRILPRIP